MSENHDTAAILGGLYGDGIIGLKGAFERAFVGQIHEQVLALYAEAAAIEGGVVPRGPQRWYVGLQPERVAGFADIVGHPWFVAVCEAVLGRDYQIVEFGFDIPFPGAADQPWHRDFPADRDNATGARLSSVAFNLTTVDTRLEHGPLEIAPGTQWDDIGDAHAGMFPDRSRWPRYFERSLRKLPQRGDISARTGLTIHRGTANRSDEPRPVLIIGVVAADVADSGVHQLEVTESFLETLPGVVCEHLFCRLVDTPGPMRQHHMIEGLLEADYG